MSKIKLIFAHIPKTAGTSFRNSLQEHYGEDQILCDYGPRSEQTSNVFASCYNSDFEGVSEKIDKSECYILSSHFHDTRLGLRGYMKIFPDADLVTIFRDPLSRIVSEYHHFKDRNGHEGRFIDMVRNPLFINRQMKSIDGVPLDSFSFIGLTETYQNSVVTFNEIFGCRIELSHDNKRTSSGDLMNGITQSNVNEFCKENITDITVYNQSITHAYRLMRRSFSVHSNKRYRGSVNLTDSGQIIGWAIDYLSEAPAMVVFETEKNRTSVVACLFREDLIQKNIHKSGYAGFSENYESVRKTLGTGNIIVSILGFGKIGEI